MFLNRNRITAEEHATTNSEASGIFDLQSQSVLKQAGRWPAVVTTVYEITYTINNTGTAFVLEDYGTVNYIVDWGDGSALETVTTNDKSHTYASWRSTPHTSKTRNSKDIRHGPRPNKHAAPGAMSSQARL